LVMKRTDPSIELIGCGHNGVSDWDVTVIQGLASVIDYYSIHLYTGQPDHYANVFSAHQAERAVRLCGALLERVRHTQRIAHPIHVAFDEWNVWYRKRAPEDRVSGVEEQFDLSDALAVGTYLNGFIRQCRIVKLANLAQLVNAIGAVFTSTQGLFRQTIYHPLRLYPEHSRVTALEVYVDGPVDDVADGGEDGVRGRVHDGADLGPFQLLDVTATCDTSGSVLTLAVVNRDKDQGHKATIDLGGAQVTGEIQVSEVTGPDVGAMNSFERPDVVSVRERTVDAPGRTLDYEFPAKSISVLRMRLR